VAWSFGPCHVRIFLVLVSLEFFIFVAFELVHFLFVVLIPLVLVGYCRRDVLVLLGLGTSVILKKVGGNLSTRVHHDPSWPHRSNLFNYTRIKNYTPNIEDITRETYSLLIIGICICNCFYNGYCNLGITCCTGIVHRIFFYIRFRFSGFQVRNGWLSLERYSDFSILWQSIAWTIESTEPGNTILKTIFHHLRCLYKAGTWSNRLQDALIHFDETIEMRCR
jgi:hypothetical protein